MRRWIVLLGVINPLIASADTVEVRERTEFYAVRGTTAEHLSVQMSQAGPSKRLGRRAWAFTEWEVRSKYVLVPGNDGCRLVEPRVSLDIVTTLPRWHITSGARWKVRARWKRLIASIMVHENAHKQHGLLAAERTAAALTKLPMQSECTIAERSAREILRREVANARQLSKEFDRVTNFGANEGVGLAHD